MTISLDFLAPDFIKAAIDGRLPHGMGVARLTDSLAEWSVSAPSSLPQKFRFLASTPLPTETLSGCMRLLPRGAEHLVLPGPFRWQVGEASDAHAMRQPAIDCGLDKIGGEESQ